jgi:translation initiation factor 2 beta subunit (eIF-2beta)/eIF-5
MHPHGGGGDFTTPFHQLAIHKLDAHGVRIPDEPEVVVVGDGSTTLTALPSMRWVERYTVVSNLESISRMLSRRERTIANYIAWELHAAVCWDFMNSRLLIDKGEVTSDRLQKILSNFIRKFVLCPFCNLGETAMNIDYFRANVFLSCANCGANYSIMDATKLLTQCID